MNTITIPVATFIAAVWFVPFYRAVFPWFIVNKLPVGVSGLLVAAIIAAAMSTIAATHKASPQRQRTRNLLISAGN